VPAKLRSGTAGSDYWKPWSHHRSARAVREHGFAGSKMGTRDFANSSGKHPVTSRGGEKWNEGGKKITFAVFRPLVYAMTREAWLQTVDAHELRASCPYACAAGPLEAYSRESISRSSALAQPNAPRDHSLINAFTEMLFARRPTTCWLRLVRASNIVITIRPARGARSRLNPVLAR